MAFAQSFNNQSSVLKINVMVVDDDDVFLQILSRMLEKSKYRDPSVMEITVIAAKGSIEALSTLKVHRHNIDLVITDYCMPEMNGLQLKRRITEEFGNLPVIVMSSNTDIEQESLTCGAMGFLPKPIKPADLTKIYQLALTYKRNGKSISWTERNHKDTDVSVPQQIKLLPEQANVLKTKKKKYCSPKSDSKSVISTSGSCVSTDGSRNNRKRNGESLSHPSKKKKISWSDSLQALFLQAIGHIGLDKAVPKKILAFMNVPYLTRENVASHLQKYRIFLRKVTEVGEKSMMSSGGIDSISSYAHHIKDPYFNYYNSSTSWYGTSLNNRSFYSKSAHSLGQSRLLSNTRDPVRFNQMPYNYMNRSSSYEPYRIGSGSNLTLPIQSNLSFTNQSSQNEGRRSFFEPPVMANKIISQTSQVLGSGQHGPSANSGNNFNSNMMSGYGSFTPNQPEPSHLTSYGMQSLINNENAAYNPQPHENATTQPNFELPQLENLNLYGDLSKTNELLGEISNFHVDHNKQQEEEAASTQFELPADFPTELNQNFSLDNDGDWTFVNTNQGQSNGETSNTVAAPETNTPIVNMDSSPIQEQDVPDFTDWSFLEPQDLADDDFMNSIFNNDMN